MNILVVEDNEVDAKIFQGALAKADLSWACARVSNGIEALDYILNKEPYDDKLLYPRPDVIVLDINLPKMDGLTFVKEMRKLEYVCSIPIMIFTVQEEMRDLFRMEGVTDYFLKTIDAKDLIDRLRAYQRLHLSGG